MWTVESITDILENHEIELHSLNRQAEWLAQTLEEDLEEIRHCVYPGAVQYDGIKVQTSGGSPDARMVSVVQACDKRREQHKKDVEVILARMAEIRAVYTGIQRLDAVSKATLLNLYYPRTPMEAVAELMDVDRGTVSARKKRAIEKLKKVLEKPAQLNTTQRAPIFSDILKAYN